MRLPLSSQQLSQLGDAFIPIKNSEVPSTELKPPKKSSEILKLITLTELFAEPEERFNYLVEGFLPAGGLSLLSAKPKTGKSTLARQLALAVSQGSEFLGRTTEKGLVIYLAFEERKNDIRSHFQKMGVTHEENIKIFAGISPAEGMKLLRKTAEHEKPVLIIVDTLARLVKIRDMNDYSQVTLALEPLLSLSREVGSHVLLLHHAKKGDSKGIDSVLGSTGLTASVDTIINLHRTENYRTLSSIQRDGKDIPETILQFDSETQLTHLGVSRQETEICSLEEDIIAFLQQQSEPVIEKKVEEGVEGKTAYKRKALRHLVETQKIIRTGKGGRGSPFLYSSCDSCSLVPSISEEQGNENSKLDLNPYNSINYSCSQDSTDFVQRL